MPNETDKSSRSLEIRNYLPSEVEITLDGQPLIGVASSTTTVVKGIPTGLHTYVAISGEKEVANLNVDMTEQEGHFVWTLGEQGSVGSIVPLLRVRNYAGEAVQIVVNGRPRVTIDPGDSARMTGVPTGRVSLEARSLSGGIIASTTADMVSGMERIWTVEGADGPTSLLVVLNHTAGPLKICIDGRFCTRVEAGRQVEYPALAPGKHHIEAFDWATDRLVDDFAGDLAPNTPYDWVVEGV